MVQGKEFLRRSPRLIENGYYGPSDPLIRRICCKESPIRIIKRRKRRRKVDRVRRNLISDFHMCDFNSVESQAPLLMPKTSYKRASLLRRMFSTGWKIVLFTLLLVLLGFGVWSCYTRAHVYREFSSLKQATTQHRLNYMKGLELMYLMMRQRLHKKEVEGMIRSAINLHRADDIGMTDYALESLGATVISSTETFETRYCEIFGLKFWCNGNRPETVLQPDTSPGKCWLFKGSKGFLAISLYFPVRITHVSLEHIPKVLSPRGNINNAPREFAVFGLDNENDEGKFLGTFEFDQEGESVQTFKLPNLPNNAFRLVKLMILSNWEFLRRSPRLIENGYYDPNDPLIRRICYKESPVRHIKRRKRRRKVDRVRRNLISDFHMCDFNSVESQAPLLMPKTSYKRASLLRRMFSTGWKIVLFTLLLVLLGFGVWSCYTRAHVYREFSSLKQATTQHRLDYMKWLELMYLMMRQRLHKKEVEGMIRRAINLHRADDVGMADYALGSLGATVISSTETYKTRYCKLFGFKIWCNNNGPETVLQPDISPGKCWLLKGSKGFLAISLYFPVRITHVSLEHIPKVLSPMGNINSAPREFAVFGLDNENDEGKFLGTFEFDQEGESVQTFKLPNLPNNAFRLVKLMILSNWGDPEFTCIYRFRVHGQI